MQKVELNDVSSGELQEEIIEKKPEEEKSKKEPKVFEGAELSEQEKARYTNLLTSVEKMKIIDDLDTYLPNVDPSELTRADLDILEKYLKIRRAGFKPEAVSAFENELSEIQLKPEEQGSASHSFLGSLRTKVAFQASEHLKGKMKDIETGVIKEEVPTEYQQEKLDDFWNQVKRLKGADRNKKLQDIKLEFLGEDEHKIWKKFKQFSNEGWPKIRISEFKKLLSEHELIVRKLSNQKGEAGKAKSIKYFIEYLEAEVDKEVEKSEE